MGGQVRGAYRRRPLAEVGLRLSPRRRNGLGIRHQRALEPPRSREQSELVRVVRQLHGAIGLAEWEGELATGTAVARVRVGGPLEVTHAPAVRRVVAAMFGAWLEILGNVVGYEDRHATHPAVLVRSSDGPS
jgi:hypothetical protein